MRILVTSLILLFASVSFGESKYDRIKYLFDTGEGVTLSRLDTVMEGRCFNKSRPDETSRMAFGLPIVTDKSAGPEFEKDSFMILIFEYIGTGPVKRSDLIESAIESKVTPIETSTEVQVTLDGLGYIVRANDAYVMLRSLGDDSYCYFYQGIR